MNTAHIIEFLSLAQTRNFQESAYDLNISQSALSKHIQLLEAELGCSLFTRTTRHVSLNEYGELFYNFALRYQELFRDYQSNLNRIRLQDERSLSVAYDPVMGSYDIIDLLSSFAQEHPQITLNMVESRQATELLHSNNCNYVVAIRPDHPSGNVECIPYMTDHLCVIVPSGHPFASLDSVSVEQLKNETFIAYNDSFGDLNCFFQLCQQNDVTPANVIRTIFKTNAIKMVRHGVGVSVLSYRQARDSEMLDTTNTKIIDLAPKCEFTICFMRLRNHRRTPSEQAFGEYVRSLPRSD